MRLLPFVACAAAAACGVQVWEPSLHDADQPPPASSDDTPFLKAHLASGDLVVFTSWDATADETGITGQGVRYDPARTYVAAGVLTVPGDSVALLESNRPGRVSRLAHGALMYYTVSQAALTAICLTDPKGCFGSCPTFYLLDDSGEALVAEGFSASFARVLEDTDVDRLPAVAGAGRRLDILMRNEAPESHAVRSIRLLAVPRPAGGEVVATGDGRLFLAGTTSPAASCRTDEGEDCLRPLRLADGHEFFTGADSTDLGAEQVIELQLPAPPGEGELALHVRARNSLLSTFLFYQAIAALGDRAGDWLAEMERGDPAVVERSLGLARTLGNIDVRVERDDGTWRRVGSFGEVGPIASDEHAVPLGIVDGDVRVRLVMTRGNWRIDRIDLVRLMAAVEPIAIEPSAVRVARSATGKVRDDVDHHVNVGAAAALHHPERYLVTQRGDAYVLSFELPGPVADHALFLESRGYYYEWMRSEWLAEQDLDLARLIFTDPDGALRRLAPVFVAKEEAMERAFWSSRFRGAVR